jgi:exonuclease III
MSMLRILQYNVQKSKDGVLIPLIDGNHAPYDIIAVQEPWINPYVTTTYCPRSCPYTLVYPQQGRARTCIYVNKQIPLAQWHSGSEPDYCWVKLELDSGPLTIHNIYSETPKSHETTEWNTPIPQVLEAIQTSGQHLIVGDFNLHHTLWGGQRVSKNHAGAALLVSSLCTDQLDLLTEPGTITREKHQNEPSTLDLALSTPNLTPWVVRCKVVDAYFGSDHKPIETAILTGSQVRTNTLPKRNFKKADTYAIAAGAKWLQTLVQELATA